GWNPDRERSESRKDSATASGSAGRAWSARRPVRSRRNRRTFRSGSRWEARPRKEREQEAFRDGLRVGRPSLERAKAGEEQEEQANVPLVLFGHLVYRLEHGFTRGEQAEGVPNGPERGDDLGLADGVEGASAPVTHQGEVGEGLEARAEPAGGLTDALGDGPNLARALG